MSTAEKQVIRGPEPDALESQLTELEAEIEQIRDDLNRDDVRMSNAECYRRDQSLEYIARVESAVETIRDFMAGR
ncbi:MAG: hypothetical protein ABEH64_13000 [Salinirussus sp.]